MMRFEKWALISRAVSAKYIQSPRRGAVTLLTAFQRRAWGIARTCA
jgi:hypothetical protein